MRSSCGINRPSINPMAAANSGATYGSSSSRVIVIPYTPEAARKAAGTPVIMSTPNRRQPGVGRPSPSEQDPEAEQAEHQRPGEQVTGRRKGHTRRHRQQQPPQQAADSQLEDPDPVPHGSVEGGGDGDGQAGQPDPDDRRPVFQRPDAIRVKGEDQRSRPDGRPAPPQPRPGRQDDEAQSQPAQPQATPAKAEDDHPDPEQRANTANGIDQACG